MSKNTVMRDVAAEFMLNHGKIQSMSEIDDIEGMVIDKTAEAFSEHNAICERDRKWKMPDVLSNAQIALIMANGFNIIKVNYLDAKNAEKENVCPLAIYVNETVAEIIGTDEITGTYTDSDDYIRTIIGKFNFNMTSHDIDEVIKKLSDLGKLVPKRRRCDERDLIPVNNGIFNYVTKTLIPYSPEYVFMGKSPVNYNPNARNVMIHNSNDNTDWDVDSWFESLAPNDPGIVKLLWQITGALLRPYSKFNVTAWMYSERGNNGKGSLCEMFRCLLGNTACASIPLSDFSKEFALEPLTRASAIVVDENDVGIYIDKSANLKSVVTHDVVSINRKNKPIISFQFHGFMVQCLNEFPKIKDKSDSFARRQLFIPMNACFTGIERKYIKDDYLHRQDVLEYILKTVLEMNYYELSIPDACKQMLEDYRETNDPIRFYWNSVRELLVWSLVPFDFLYSLYKAFYEKMVSGSAQIVQYKVFVNEIKKLVDNDDIWGVELVKDGKDQGRLKQYRISQNDFAIPEPLIYEYGLNDWMNKSYKGSSIDQICIPTINKESNRTRGLIRKQNLSET